MTDPRLARLLNHGQSPWLDQLRREWLTDGTLAAWIDAGVRGVTSNPTIFAEAFATGDAYAAQIKALAAKDLDPAAIYDAVTLDDIRAACDLFLPTYADTYGNDGFVSHEVAPALARDTEGTVAEARRLWRAIKRPNAMIKIPATDEGVRAVEICLAEGININITLMFGLSQYEAVGEAYMKALEKRVDDGDLIDRVSSVASFFVSRVDTKVDTELRRRIADAPADDSDAELCRALLGRAAVANATRAYARFQARFGEGQSGIVDVAARWTALTDGGARMQRVLWASTGTKDKSYSDVKYVTNLVAPETVNTLPVATLEAFLDHGEVGRILGVGTRDADKVAAQLESLGIDLEQVAAELLDEGLVKFAASYDDALATVARSAQTAG